MYYTIYIHTRAFCAHVHKHVWMRACIIYGLWCEVVWNIMHHAIKSAAFVRVRVCGWWCMHMCVMLWLWLGLLAQCSGAVNEVEVWEQKYARPCETVQCDQLIFTNHYELCVCGRIYVTYIYIYVTYGETFARARTAVNMPIKCESSQCVAALPPQARRARQAYGARAYCISVCMRASFAAKARKCSLSIRAAHATATTAVATQPHISRTNVYIHMYIYWLYGLCMWTSRVDRVHAIVRCASDTVSTTRSVDMDNVA